jgi:dihydroorotase
VRLFRSQKPERGQRPDFGRGDDIFDQNIRSHPELGQIAVGSVADIAVLRVEHGNFGYSDLAGGKVDGSERILPEMTIRAGHILFDLNARTAVPWREGHLKYATR